MTFRLRLLRETCRPHPFRGTGKPSAQRHPCDVTVTVRFRDGAREGGSLGCADPSQPPLQETFGAQDMSGMRRYEVALEAEEDSAHPGEQKLEPLRGLMSCLSSGLGPAPQRSGRGLPRRSPAAAVQPASALKI
uniref:uncharacterized protein LOC100397075 isoform X2 n=1 Tax=Callithrix jacchus TaxID=9483 RepID=UPI00083F6A62|nr:uncharacterized protein LOC100397075 isoform X2 [Callithrix jacchus]